MNSEPQEMEDERSPPGRPEEGIGICLSGGGYRAMLYHVGALWRLNEVGLLARAARISSVSGGSITAAWLARIWAEQKWPKDSIIPEEDFRITFAENLCRLADHTIDVPSVLFGLFSGSVGGEIADRYDHHLFSGATLQDLPDYPRFVINASNLQTGRLWRFSKPYMEDYLVGPVFNPTLRLADAVAASSAFPPVLSPIRLRMKTSDYGQWPGKPAPRLQHPPFTTTPTLADGGVYDNLGLETVFKRYKTVFVSDGGAPFSESKRPWAVWPLQILRVLGCIDNQVRSLRKRQLMDSFDRSERSGCYWGIGTPSQSYPKCSLSCDSQVTACLADESTRLRAIKPKLQKRLINWGYASCSASLESNYAQSDAPPSWPYPEAPLS